MSTKQQADLIPSIFFKQLSLEGKIVCDFDGTITPFDVTDAILENFALSKWRDVEEKWLKGELTAKECMRQQVELIRITKNELDDFIDSVPLDDAFKPFVDFCNHHGIELMIISDGMDYVIKRILSRHGLINIPLVANKLLIESDKNYRLEFPFSRGDCSSGVCKCFAAAGGTKKTLLIGDGYSDCCLAASAFFVLAKKGRPLLRFCEKKSISCLAYESFNDIVSLFAALSSTQKDVDIEALVG